MSSTGSIDGANDRAIKFFHDFFQPTILLPIVGFAGVIVLWWIIALFRQEMMPTPPEALAKNLDFILHPFYRRGPGDLGLGWLLLASLRRVCIGFLLGAMVAVPVGVWIGLSHGAWLALNPIIQVFKPVSPLVWLPIALAIFNAAWLERYCAAASNSARHCTACRRSAQHCYFQ